MTEERKSVTELIDFIYQSPSCFHAVSQVKRMLMNEGFLELSKKYPDECSMKNGGKYFTIRNDSSLIAFSIPNNIAKGFHIVASHCDSPTFKLKEKPELKVEEAYCKLNVEKYGGMILSTWLDRPLGIAGRVVVREKDTLISKLIDMGKNCCVIPNVAIHFNKEINKGYEYNPQVDMLPLFSSDKDADISKIIAAQLSIKKEDILGSDLFLYNSEKGMQMGINGEFLLSPRLDDLECAFATLQGFMKANPKDYIAVYCLFDNEEVGSNTRQGAGSDFLFNILNFIADHVENKVTFETMIEGSFLISADNAHALHPNHPEMSDVTNKPYLNQGVVLKFNGNAHYTTDAFSAAMIRTLSHEAFIKLQTFANRSDIMGGSTLGNISNSQVSIASADIGLAQLAMHSAMETTGCTDLYDMIKLIETFHNK